jgi:dTMP kinase
MPPHTAAAPATQTLPLGSGGAGLFLSFEGIDGAGKSTHIPALANWLQLRGHRVTVTREPGGTPLAERLRELLLHETMDPLSEALLMFAARREHVLQVIAPALARGDVVLCDRFTDATFAYQGHGRGFDVSVLATLEHWVHGGLQPHCTLWFDVPPAVAAARLAQARSPDKFESESLEFFTRVAAGYAARMAADPRRFARIPADRTPEQVWVDVQAAVQALLPEPLQAHSAANPAGTHG